MTNLVNAYQQKDIPLFVTNLTMFEACGILYTNGLRGVAERQKDDGATG